MTHLATMGTDSCATFSIAGFKNQRDSNEAYKASPPSNGLSVGIELAKGFYNRTILPISQPLAKSNELPFEQIMQGVDADYKLKAKFCAITINHTQFMGDGKYWPKEFKRWGFVLSHKTANNSMGGVINYIYIRDPAAVPVKPEDHV